MNFILRDNEVLKKSCEENGIIRILCERILQIGRNVHLLRLLGKYDVFTNENTTIHEEFKTRFIEQLKIFYEYVEKEENIEVEEIENCKKNTTEDWWSTTDTSDGFFMKVFGNFRSNLEKTCEKTKNETLFQQ